MIADEQQLLQGPESGHPTTAWEANRSATALDSSTEHVATPPVLLYAQASFHKTPHNALTLNASPPSLHSANGTPPTTHPLLYNLHCCAHYFPLRWHLLRFSGLLLLKPAALLVRCNMMVQCKLPRNQLATAQQLQQPAVQITPPAFPA
jgi:hypothetical protein